MNEDQTERFKVEIPAEGFDRFVPDIINKSSQIAPQESDLAVKIFGKM